MDNKQLWNGFFACALTGMLAHSRNGHGYRPRDPAQHWHLAIAEEAGQIADQMLEVALKRWPGRDGPGGNPRDEFFGFYGQAHDR